MIGIDRCESPIERALAVELSMLAGFQWRSKDDYEGIVGRWPGWSLALFSQAPISPYRSDFLVCSEHGRDLELMDEMGRPPWGLVIECDGHDYHERTKAQARRDRQRDREMTAADITVFRFTGSEIYRDVARCAAEAMEMALKIQRPRMDQYFTDWLLKAKERPECST